MKNHHHIPRRLSALLLVLAVMLSLVPTAFAGQQDSYHDPAEHWKEANNRTNELDANAVVTIETFTCGECGKATASAARPHPLRFCAPRNTPGTARRP